MKKIFLPLIYSVLMRNFLRLIVGVHYQNRAVLKKEKQFIIVANHNSHVDTMALLSALPPGMIHKTHPVAAGDYFGKSNMRAGATRFFVNALLIPRSRPKPGESGPDPIQMMIDKLDEGHSLILFPEGSRGEPDKMQKFKRGIGILLEQRPNIPFIPVFMKGMGKVLPKGDKVMVPFDTYATFGEPRKCNSSAADGIVKEVEESILWLNSEE